MSVTPEIEAEIMREHRATPTRFSPFKVAKKVGATVGEVIAVVNRNRNATDPDASSGLKRPELEKYIVASRRANEPGWNNEDVGVARARAAFEAGTHDMATHRDGVWLHLCSFPLSRPRKPKAGYFA